MGRVRQTLGGLDPPRPPSYIERRGQAAGGGGIATGAMVMRSVAVFGGTGFLGRAVVDQLVAAGMKVRVAVRHPEPIKLSDGTAQAEHVLVCLRGCC